MIHNFDVLPLDVLLMSKETWEDIVEWTNEQRNEEPMSIETIAQAGPLTFLGFKIPKGFGYLETEEWVVAVMSRRAWVTSTGDYNGEVYWIAEWRSTTNRAKIRVGPVCSEYRGSTHYKTPQEALNALGEELACLSKTLASMQEWKLP